MNIMEALESTLRYSPAMHNVECYNHVHPLRLLYLFSVCPLYILYHEFGYLIWLLGWST